MILSKEDTLLAAQRFIDYYRQFDSILDYQMKVKEDRVGKESKKEEQAILPFFDSPYDDFFQAWDMSPNEMEFSFLTSNQPEYNDKTWVEKLDVVSSHGNMSHIPGRRLRILIKEKNTNTIIGFIHLGSPVISMRPRHDTLGGVPNMYEVNNHTVMGNVIVPTQPFGFNYLGGKLLALICCSHWVREHFNARYDNADICLFETTSLYGTTKGMSMYDGLKPFLRHGGDTVSDFPPTVHDRVFTEWNHWFKALNGGENLVPMTKVTKAGKTVPMTSWKDRTQQKMKSIIKNSLKHYGLKVKLAELNQALTDAKQLTERKRYYHCSYGYDNVSDVLLHGADPVVNQQNWDKHYLENIIAWWRKKAQKRWEKLRAEGQLRTQLEIQGTGMDIDIIR